MIADRRSEIAIRSAIVYDHMETYFCDRLRSCYRDCRRSQEIKPWSISCDRLRSIAIVRSYGNQSFAIRDRNASHNISCFLPRFNIRVFDCRNGQRSNTQFVVIMAVIEHVGNEELMEEVARYEGAKQRF